MSQAFADYIKENIVGYLPDDLRDAEISVEDVVGKNNRKTQALVIEDSSTEGAPRIYLDELEKQYINGRGMNEILQDIAKIRVQADTLLDNFSFDPSSIRDYEAMKPRLAIAMCDYNKNEDFLKDKPYTRVASLAAYYRVNIIEDYLDGMINVQSAVITDKMLDIWQITKGQLHRDALRSEIERRGVTFVFTSDYAEKGIENIENLYYRQDPLPQKTTIYQLSNNYIYNGAGVIMQNGVLDRVGKLLGRDFYVLPSSIHEVMILPVTPYITRDQLIEMITNANKETCMPYEVLSDKPLYYNRKQRALYSL